MKTSALFQTIQIPKNFKLLPDLIAEGLTGQINYFVADSIKGRQACCPCSAFGVHGQVWWSKPDNLWYIQLLKGVAENTGLSGETIEDLMDNIRKYACSKRGHFFDETLPNRLD